MNDICWGFPLYTAFSRNQYVIEKGLQNFLAHALTMSPTDQILDVGCGIGTLARLLAPSLITGQVEGVDLDSSLIEYGRQTLQGLNIHLNQGDARRLAFPADCFDFVVSMGLFEFIKLGDREQVLAEMLRVLKRAGKLVMVHLDVQNYSMHPRERWFGQFWRDLLQGMELWGADLDLSAVLPLCERRMTLLRKATYLHRYAAVIDDQFIASYLRGLGTNSIPDDIMRECIAFNHQFVKTLGWTRKKLRDLFLQTYSIAFQKRLLTSKMGSEFKRTLPIHLYLFRKA